MKAKKKEQTPMEKLTQGFEKFIKDKEAKEANREQFDKVIKQASITKPKKQHGSK